MPVDAEALEGRVCYGGLDLSSTTDVTAFVLVFPPTDEDESFAVLPRPVEREKIHCGKAHFRALGEEADFVAIDDYEKFRTNVCL